MIFLRKRGLSPIIGTMLLISLTILIAAIIFAWAQSFFKESAQKYGEPTENACEKVIFEAEITTGGKIYVSNKGSVPLSRIEVRKIGLGGSETVEIKSAQSYSVKFGEIKEFELKNALNSGDEVLIVPILLGQSKNSPKEHICDEGYSIKTEVR